MSEQVEEDDFWRYRRSCVQELWQSLLGGVGALPVAQLLAAEAREGAAVAAGGGGWRRLEAALHLSECAAPALLPQGRRPTRRRLVSAGGNLRAASDSGSGGNGGGGNGGEAAARAARAAETSDAFADTAEQRALAPSVEAALSAACGVGDGAPPYLRAAALRCIAAFAPWLAPAERAQALQGCVQAVLRSLGDPSVGRHAASAFSAICCYGGCAWRLGTDATLQQLLPPLLAALEQEPFASGGALDTSTTRPRHVPQEPLASDGEAAETARSACMRLVVLLPPASIAAALDAIASPILASLPALGATLAAADDAESIAAAGAAIAAALARLRSVARHLDSSPPLPQPGGGQAHPMVLLLGASRPSASETHSTRLHQHSRWFPPSGAAWPVLQPLAAPSARSAASFRALCDFFVLAMRAGGAAPLLPWLPQLLDTILAGLAAHNLAHALALASDGAVCALQTLAAAVERFGPEEAATPLLSAALGRAAKYAVPNLAAALGASQDAAAPLADVCVAFLELLYRAALFCSEALPPPLLDSALALCARALRQPSRDLVRAAAALAARLAESDELRPRLLASEAGPARALLGGLLVALASHAAHEMLPRVADAMRALLSCCGAEAGDAVLRAAVAPRGRAARELTRDHTRSRPRLGAPPSPRSTPFSPPLRPPLRVQTTFTPRLSRRSTMHSPFER